MFEVSKYEIVIDENGNVLNGSKQYRCHLPPNIPVREFWSVLVYDVKSRLLIKNHQSWPSVHSNLKNLAYCVDGSVDVLFGPTPPVGKESNWIQTIPRKRWYMVVNLYDPLESRISETWKPGAIVEVTDLKM